MEVGWCVDHGIAHSEFLSWSTEDRAKVVAHLLEVAGRCQSCGTRASEWEEDKFAYEPVAISCRGCLLKDAAQDDAPTIAGTTVTLVPKAVAQAMRDRPMSAPR